MHVWQNNLQMNFSKNMMIIFLWVMASSQCLVLSSPTTDAKNETGESLQLSGWKPMTKPKALTTSEFAEMVSSPKAQNSSDLETSDTTRSFILVYPPRPSGSEDNSQKAETSQNAERNQGPPVRPDPTQSRHHRMMNFRAAEDQNKKVSASYQRPKFPPVANPPPLPEHALRNRKRIPPNFTPESTSQHQVQIQLLDGYIVPPQGGNAPNAEKKAPQITTFPLNLNNVPEIRLLLPGDVHAQLNNLRQHPHQQQNRHSSSHPESQSSDGRNNNQDGRNNNQDGRNNNQDGRNNNHQTLADKTNIHSFESQRRPGRTVEYGNNRNNGVNGSPQQGSFNQNQDRRKLNNDFSQPDPAVYPEAVNFPGQHNQNFLNTINNPVSHNHVKSYSGEVPTRDDLLNRDRFPDQPRDNRLPVTQTKIHGTTNEQGFPQNYGSQLNPGSDSRTPISQTTIHDSTIGQGLPQNYGNQQNPVSDHRTPISQSVIHDSPNGQGFPQNYGGQQNPVIGDRTPISQSVIHDSQNGQGFPQNYRGQQNPVTGDRTPISQSVIRDSTNGQGFPQNYGGQQNPVTGDRTPISQTKIHDGTNDQIFPQSYGSQENPVPDNRGHAKSHGTTNVNNYSPNFGSNLPVGNRNPVHSKTQGTVNVQSYSPDFRGLQNPSTDNRNPIHSKTQGTVNVQNYSPGFRNQQNPSVDNRSPVHSKTQGSVNVQNYSPDFRSQQNPSVDNRSPVHSKTQGSVNVQSYSPDLRNQQNPSVDNRNHVHSKTQGSVNVQSYSPDFQQNPAVHNRTPIHSKPQGSVHVQSYSPNQRGQESPTNDNRTPIHSKTNVHSNSPNFGGQRNPSHVKTHTGNSHPGQVPIETFQRTREYEREHFRPLSNSNRNYNPQHNQNGNSRPTSQNHNRAVSGSTNQRSKLNENGRNGYSNGWRATPSSRGKQNYNPVGSTAPGKTNIHSGNSGIRNPQDGQNNGQSGPNFDSFGPGDTHQKSHGSAFSPSAQDSFGPGDTHQKSHGSNFSPSAHDSRGSPGPGHDKSDSSQFNRDGRTSAEDFNTRTNLDDKKAGRPQSSTADDIYFVPPVLSQEQEQIDPFDGPVSRDTTGNSDVATPVSTAREDGLINQKDISEYVNVDSVGRQPDSTFARTEYCECAQNCAPIQRSPDENLGSSIREIARSLNADAFFDFVGLTDEEIENTLASDGSYTLFIPSNEAVSRLPSNLIDHWRENNPDLTTALLNHVVRDTISLEQLKLGGRMTSRANDATIFINNYNNEAVTVNGHRIVHGDISAPKGGTIHVIDGTLCPVADQDIINTLRTCNKYDGFLTLADVTKLLDTMQGEGPYTVFLPSNEALTKIPADELTVLKENSTVLREFLEYHIVKGAYFSGDLKDGQYLTTLHERQPIRMGIRADGCYRRLVEVNNSPLFKSDIPTKNGVIHVVDWILRPSDLKWCDGVILP